MDRVAAQAYSSFEQASVVTVAKEAVLTEPIRIAVHGEGGVAYGHQVIELGAFAEAVVVIDHTGDTVLAANVDYVLGDGAKLTVVSVQDWDEQAVHVGQHNALVGRDASFKSIVVTFGGDLVRLHPRIAYAGPGGEAELFGLYFTDKGQHQEHRLLVDHNAPHCKSNVAYKGALQGDGAHAVWIGDVLIQASAEGTDTYEMNRNLVLTDGARVDSVPNLEIETGEIVGATTPPRLAASTTSSSSTSSRAAFRPRRPAASSCAASSPSWSSRSACRTSKPVSSTRSRPS